MKVYLGTLGCKLNQAETERLARRLIEAGHYVVNSKTGADVYILNTCTVTGTADAKCRAWLRQVRRREPEARLLVTGCYARRKPGDFTGMEGISLAAGNDDGAGLLALVQASGSHAGSSSASGDSSVRRTRAFVKVQDGCNRPCTYCIVPMVRGPEKSQPANRIIDEIRLRVSEGYREIVLTGTEIGSYQDRTGVEGLLRRILTDTGVSRLRLSSFQPAEISPELLDLWRDERLCPHFHLSLQSGSDRVLRRMKRGYETAGYQRAVGMIRDIVPDVAVTTDIIVGFPGENEDEFMESYDFCRQSGFARIHVFPYSSRPDTEASRMPDQVDAGVKRDRCRKMLSLAKESSKVFRERFSGRSMPVLWEARANGIWSGLTGNYIKVYTRSDDDLTNKVLMVKLGENRAEGVWGDRG